MAVREATKIVTDLAEINRIRQKTEDESPRSQDRRHNQEEKEKSISKVERENLMKHERQKPVNSG